MNFIWENHNKVSYKAINYIMVLSNYIEVLRGLSDIKWLLIELSITTN